MEDGPVVPTTHQPGKTKRQSSPCSAQDVTAQPHHETSSSCCCCFILFMRVAKIRFLTIKWEVREDKPSKNNRQRLPLFPTKPVSSKTIKGETKKKYCKQNETSILVDEPAVDFLEADTLRTIQASYRYLRLYLYPPYCRIPPSFRVGHPVETKQTPRSNYRSSLNQQHKQASSKHDAWCYC